MDGCVGIPWAPHFTSPRPGLWAEHWGECRFKGHASLEPVVPAPIIQLLGTLAFPAQWPKPISSLLRSLPRPVLLKMSAQEITYRPKRGLGQAFWGVRRETVCTDWYGSIVKSDNIQHHAWHVVDAWQMLFLIYFLSISSHIFCLERERERTTMRIHAFTGGHYFNFWYSKWNLFLVT